MSCDEFPIEGTDAAVLLGEIEGMRSGDADWRGGRTFSMVYNAADPELEHLLDSVGTMYLHESALNPFKFPSLLQMERDIISMAADLLDGSADSGSITSGGTESIFLAVQVARDDAAATRGIEEPNMVAAKTIHPAFVKACAYLNVGLRRVAVGPDGRADLGAMTEAVDENTALIVGSAPCYPFGVIDPIPEIAAFAKEKGILCHVDACLGGWILPFWEEIGETVRPWRLSVPGVTSLSADVHKYGYTFKGVSTLMYSDRSLLKRQHFIFEDWPGGLYGSATTAGTRPAAPIAGAWTAIRYLGQHGYLQKTGQVRDATRRIRGAIDDIDGLSVTGQPDMSVFEFGSDRYDMAAIGDVMDRRGWHLDRQAGGLHVILFPGHSLVADEFISDLGDAVANHGQSDGKVAVYGGIA